MSARNKVVIAAVCVAIAAAFVLLPSIGPLALPNGARVGFPGIRLPSNEMAVGLGSPDVEFPAVSPAIAAGTHAVRVTAAKRGALLEGGTYWSRAASLPETSPVQVARWTLWTRFQVDGKSVSASTFFYSLMRADGEPPVTLVVARPGVIDSIKLDTRR